MEGNTENSERNPSSASKICNERARRLFAEKMLEFIMGINDFNASLISSEHNGNLVHNAFTVNVMISIAYLERILIEDITDVITSLSQRNLVTSEGFELYSRSLVSSFVEQEDNTESILKMCVQIAFTASFYYDMGIETAPHTAIAVIADAIEFDLKRGGWEMVQAAALNFESMNKAIENTPSPSTDGDRSSDGE